MNDQKDLKLLILISSHIFFYNMEISKTYKYFFTLNYGDPRLSENLIGCSYVRSLGEFHICFSIYSQLNMEMIKNASTKYFSLKSLYQDKSKPIILNAIINDPDLDKMWHIKSSKSDNKLSHHIEDIWKIGITGKGVIVAIIDSGIDFQHRDLADNYLADFSYNYVDNSRDQFPYLGVNHGTMSAGIISATANNSFCGAGIAPSSKFISLKIFRGRQKRLEQNIINQALAFTHLNNIVSIYSIGWDKIISKALEIGFKKGRKGLGSIYIMPGCNKGRLLDSCGFNSYLQRPEVIAINSIERDGSVPAYAEKCTAILASTLSSSIYNITNSIYTTQNKNKCSNIFTGTSASVAVASGIVALILEVNPNLSVRDIINLIIKTSTQYDKKVIRNAAGYSYSLSFGFGLMMPFKLVSKAYPEKFKKNLLLKICSSRVFRHQKTKKRPGKIDIVFYTTGCYGTKNELSTIEQVYVVFDANCYTRRNMNVTLISPSRTSVPILIPSPRDRGTHVLNWKVKVMTLFGEKAYGVWNLSMRTNSIFSSSFGNAQLIIHGVNDKKVKLKQFHERLKEHLCNKTTISSFVYSIWCKSEQIPKIYKLDYDVYSFFKEDYLNISLLKSSPPKHLKKLMSPTLTQKQWINLSMNAKIVLILIFIIFSIIFCYIISDHVFVFRILKQNLY